MNPRRITPIPHPPTINDSGRDWIGYGVEGKSNTYRPPITDNSTKLNNAADRVMLFALDWRAIAIIGWLTAISGWFSVWWLWDAP